MKRLLAVILACIVGMGVASFVPATTQAQRTTPYYPRIGKILGIVPPVTTSSTGLPVATGQPSTGALYYNGGPVMKTNKVYTIFWAPPGYSFDATYQSQINQFFKDVQGDNGKNSNAYDAATQYSTDGTNTSTTPHIQYNSTFAGTAVDNNALPPLDPVNCPDTPATVSNGVDRTSPGNTPTPTGNAYCVTDGQLQQEISNVIKANHWTTDNTTEFFMYTAPNIGTCIPAGVGTGAGNVQTTVTVPLCSFSYFCAYHSWYFDSTVNPNSQIIYSNMPYAYETRGQSPTCDTRIYPNGNGGPDAADPEINVTSHEHNESITDPFGTGWWDSNPNDSSAGMETGDMCAYVWGTLYGNGAPSTTVPVYGTVQNPGSGIYSQQWNQTINGHHYIAQQEWSNADSPSGDGCVSKETPQFSLTPNVGYPTAPFKISGGLFFNANEPVSFTFTSAGSSTHEPLASATADDTGHVAKIMTAVPSDAQPDTINSQGQEVTATVTGSGATSGTSGSDPFTVPSP